MVLETILLAVGISSVVSYETTGKGLADHTISAVSGQDCKIARSLKGNEVCEPRGTVTISAPTKEYNIVSNSAVAEMEKVFARRKEQNNGR